MKQLTVIQHQNAEVVDSRDVAAMVEKQHNDLMKSIRSYAEHISNAGDFSLVDFFVPDTYVDTKGETRPCYLLTKKGCDMVANKMTGEKGVLFTAAYVTAFEQMREHIQSGKALPKKHVPKLPALSSVNSATKMTLQVMDEAGIDPAFKLLALRDIYAPYGLMIPTDGLPAMEKLYECTAMAEILGVMSESGKPHKGAISAIIDLVGTVDGEVMEVPFTNGSYSNAMKKYKQSVLDRVERWIKEHGYPCVICGVDGKNYKVRYTTAA